MAMPAERFYWPRPQWARRAISVCSCYTENRPQLKSTDMVTRMAATVQVLPIVVTTLHPVSETWSRMMCDWTLRLCLVMKNPTMHQWTIRQ